MPDHTLRLAALLPLACLAFSFACHAEDTPAATGGCRLVIAGGALADDNAPVWTAFIEGARPDGDIVIIPAASGYPAGSSASVKKTLISHGWPASRISLLPLATIDDPDTADIDESRWAANSTSAAIADAVANAAAIWFTGGDQARIAQLFGTGKAPLPLLEKADAACAHGAAIGGTSAGAAIMSDPMLRGGDSLPALLREMDPAQGALQTGPGLGFFRAGLVDQHFGQRAREGRLISALVQQDEATARIGFGVDENTAMIVSPDGIISVEGEGHVTVIDGRAAYARRADAGPLAASDLILHILSRGDSFETRSGRITPAKWRKPTVGHEYADRPPVSGAGIAVPAETMADLLGEGLVDNSATSSVERLTFALGTGSQLGLLFTFDQLEQSAGYWGRDENGTPAYTIANIRLGIRPISLTVEETE